MKKDYTYSSTDEDGLVAVASLSGLSMTVYFQRVDLDKKKFIGDHFHFNYLTTTKIADEEAYLRLSFQARKLPPGIYAITHTEHSTYEFNSTTVTLTCFGKGAEVYEVKPGTVNFIKFHDFVYLYDEKDIQEFMDHLKANLQIYPNITAKPVVAKQYPHVGFTDKESDKYKCDDLSADGMPFKIIHDY